MQVDPYLQSGTLAPDKKLERAPIELDCFVIELNVVVKLAGLCLDSLLTLTTTCNLAFARMVKSAR
jgi:hypothetical protein